MTVAWGHAEENRSFQEVTFDVLGQQFQDFGSATSQETVESIARESGLTVSEVRGKLRELLDEWEIQRQEKTEVWSDLVSRRSERISVKQTERFLGELGKSVREILGKEENFKLKSLSERASRKAKMLTYEGEDFLRNILGPANTQRDNTLLSVDLPEKIGILIEVGRRSTDLAQYFSRVELEAQEDFQVSVSSALVHELPKSEYVSWAVEEADPQLSPDCLLSIGFIFWFSGWQPGWDVVIVDMALEYLPNKAEIFSHCLAFSASAAMDLIEGWRSDYWLARDLKSEGLVLDSLHVDEVALEQVRKFVRREITAQQLDQAMSKGVTPEQIAQLIQEPLDEFLAGSRSAEVAGLSVPAADAELTAIERLFDEGEWEQALQKLQALLKDDQLMHHQHIRALRTLGKLHLLLGDEDLSVLAYRKLMEVQPLYFQQPSKLLRDLGFTQEEAPELLKRIIGRSSMEVIEKTHVLDNMVTARRLMTRSRRDAFLRSVALPGWGQRYMGHHRRGNILLTAAMYSLVFAALDNSDHSRGLAAGIWSVNILDAIFTGPNITSSP